MSAALERIRAWDTAATDLQLRLTGPNETKFNVAGSLKNVTDSLFAFSWQTDTVDSLPKRSFAHSDGMTVISLEDATLTLSDDPTPSVTIVRGQCECRLTELRPSNFGTV